MKNNTYALGLQCPNCMSVNRVKLPIGSDFGHHDQALKCGNCGVTSIVHNWDKSTLPTGKITGELIRRSDMNPIDGCRLFGHDFSLIEERSPIFQFNDTRVYRCEYCGKIDVLKGHFGH